MIRLEQNAITAIESDQLGGIVCITSENERPLQGLAGQVDWILKGTVSQFIKNQNITGKLGECVYLPIQTPTGIKHFLFLGVGHTSQPGKRTAVPASAIKGLSKNITGLQKIKFGISVSDFGFKDLNKDARTIENQLNVEEERVIFLP